MSNNPSFFINPLVCFGNALDCKEAIQSFDDLPCDKLRMDYTKYPYNYRIAQKYFLEHKEYTHFIYMAPDMVISVSQFEELEKRVLTNDYDVYGGVCNVDMGKYSEHLACCIKLPKLPYELRRYRWVSESQRQWFMNSGINKLRVKFNALAFCFIKREILEKYEFTTVPYETDERPIWESRGGYACDLAFAHYCDFSKIDILVDLQIKLKHLRYSGKNQVGKKDSKITFIPYIIK